PFVFPPPQTPPAGHPAGRLGGQVAPASAGAQHPENALHALPVRCPRSAPSVAPPLRLGEQMLKQLQLSRALLCRISACLEAEPIYETSPTHSESFALQ